MMSCNVDRAMRWGFNWQRGPFELLDALGPARIIDRLEMADQPLPRMLEVLRQAGAERFYADGGSSISRRRRRVPPRAVAPPVYEACLAIARGRRRRSRVASKWRCSAARISASCEPISSAGVRGWR